jgi:ketosteroid isomerase-like protein
MKTRSLLTLFGLAICFALPIFAQQKDTPEPRISQQRDLLGIPDALADFGELSGKLDDAYNKNDAEAAAALFTEDGVLVTPDGMVFGRQAIEKWYADTFQRWPVTDFLSRRDRFRLNAIDNAVWSAGEWWGTLQGQTGPVFAWGYWSTIYVREGDTWKMRMLSLFDHRTTVPEQSKHHRSRSAPKDRDSINEVWRSIQ